MQHDDLFDQLRNFRSDRLKQVSTTVTKCDGQQYLETLQVDGYAVSKSGLSTGYVVDTKADITVSLVMQGLILGSQDVAMELKILEDFNVTHILNVGYQIPNYFETKFIYKNVEILDDPSSTNIRVFFDGCFQFIDDGRQEGCTLVHCNAGLSRAPTIVIAYLMKKYNMRLKEAYALVKSVRSNIKPNEGFKKVLEDYDRELFLEKKQ